MMIEPEMTDQQVREQVERADVFIAQFREAILAAIADPVSDLEQHGQCLRRISDTVDQVPYVLMANLSNADLAMGGHIMGLIEVSLMACGGGDTLDFENASAFLAVFEKMIDDVRRRRLQ
jgi:hypothetical protein